MFALALFALQANAQDVIDKVADETCTCLEERSPAGKMESSQLEMVLGLCMLEAGGKYEDELEKEYGLKLNSVESMEKLGEVVGERMADSCDKFMEIIFAMMGEEDSELMQELMQELDEEPGDEGIIGKVISVTGEELLVIKIKSAGKTQTFHVIGDFSGENVVDKGDDLIGETVSIVFDENEIYSPKMKAFVSVKEIKKIEIE